MLEIFQLLVLLIFLLRNAIKYTIFSLRKNTILLHTKLIKKPGQTAKI